MHASPGNRSQVSGFVYLQDHALCSSSQANQGRVLQCVAEQGPALVQALLAALCNTCPRNLMRSLAMLLHGLLAGSAWQVGDLKCKLRSVPAMLCEL